MAARQSWYLKLLWHGGMGGATLWWGIRARRRVREPHECRARGYDLRGTSEDAGRVCPEGGAGVDAAGVHSPR